MAVDERNTLVEHPHRHRIERQQGERTGHRQAAVERIHDLAAVVGLDEKTANDRGDDGNTAEHQRVGDQVIVGDGNAFEHHGAEHHGRDHCHGVGFKKVSRHASTIANVVADVVGNHRRIARVVLGNAGFDLADEVGADVSALGEDAAAQPGEDRD